MKKTILTIVLAALCLICARAQTSSYKGKVTDQHGQPIPGATLTIPGTNQTTKAGPDGNFLIKKISQDQTLLISSTGYKPKTLSPGERTLTSTIILETDEKQLREVRINAGYYSVTDKQRTGSISRITSAQIEKQPVNNVLAAMQANIPGAVISQNTGMPGGGFSVQIRGRNSIQQGSQPFYIIDGVPFTATPVTSSRSTFITPDPSPLSSINPGDIESITVLKDADATAIYGSRGANGVILITTKKGKTGKAKALISFNQGLSSVANQIKLLGTEQYLAMRREAFAGDKLEPAANQYDLSGAWDQSRYTNWQKELIGGTAPSTNLLASLSGGSENLSYRIGAALYKEGTVFPTGHDFSRRSGDFNLQYTSGNKKLKAQFSANYSLTQSKIFSADLTQFIFLPPNYPALLNPGGSINWQNETMYQNPIASTQRPYDASTSNLVSSALLDYSILPGLSLRSSFGYTVMDRKEFNATPLSSQTPAFKFGPDQRISYFAANANNTWILEPQLSYFRQIGKGKLEALIGTSFQQSITDGQNIKASGYTSDALMENIAAASLLTTQERQYLQYRYTAVFGRLNYVLCDRYILNATARRDGSSRFGNENRMASFGAIGGAWIISEEKFITEKLPFISLLKLRGSYGVTGNDQISDYAYMELWNTFSSTYQGISTITPGQIANPGYAWEINKKAEAALELSLLNNQISLSAGYYSNRSSSQLIRKQLPPSTGFSSIQDNLPGKVSNTGWELELSSKNISTASFQWTSSLNLTIPKNKLLAYPGLESSADANNYQIGQPLSILKLYDTYIDPVAGLYAFRDHDQNGVINDSDRYLTALLGRKFYGGLQNTLSYKGIELDFIFQFVRQNGKSEMNGLNAPGYFLLSAPYANQPARVLDRWQKGTGNTPYQKFSTSGAAANAYITASQKGSLAVSDASFIRLKNISLSYSLPNTLTQKLKISAAKFQLQAQNLITITPYQGLDPETQSSLYLPPLRVISLGFQLSF